MVTKKTKANSAFRDPGSIRQTDETIRAPESCGTVTCWTSVERRGRSIQTVVSAWILAAYVSVILGAFVYVLLTTGPADAFTYLQQGFYPVLAALTGFFWRGARTKKDC
jgi:hypothetical protein